MSRTARSRARILNYSKSGMSYHLYPGVNGAVQSSSVIPSVKLHDEKMSDYLSAPFQSNPLTHRVGTFDCVYASGIQSMGNNSWRKSVDAPMIAGMALRGTEPFVYAGLPNKLSNSYLAQLAQANANPNVPTVDLPVSIFELGEIPKLIKQLGGFMIANLAKRGRSKQSVGSIIAEGYVAYNFGVAPVISDILSLLDVADKISERERYLRALQQEKGKRIRRKLTSENVRGQWTVSSAFASNVTPNFVVSCLADVECSRRYWYSCRAKLVHNIPARELRSRATRATLGLQHLSLAQLWEIIPWSWLIDYFVSTGTLLNAYRGGIPWVMSDLNIMCQSQAKTVATLLSIPSGLSVSTTVLNGLATEHYRSPSSTMPFPVLKLRYLSLSQLGILLSLATIKADGNGFSIRGKF